MCTLQQSVHDFGATKVWREILVSHQNINYVGNKEEDCHVSIETSLGELGCDYSSISVEVGDAVNKLYVIHQRNENARKSVKRNNSRQTNFLAFTKK